MLKYKPYKQVSVYKVLRSINKPQFLQRKSVTNKTTEDVQRLADCLGGESLNVKPQAVYDLCSIQWWKKNPYPYYLIRD